MECKFEKFFPFWQSLSEGDRRLLCSHAVAERFERSRLVHDSTGCSGLFLLVEGRLRVYILSESGKEITLYRLEPGDVCMLAASCVIQSITFDVFIEAELPSECYRIDASVFGALSERLPEVKIFALETAVQRFSDVMWVMQQLVFMNMDQRLAIFLLDEAGRTGQSTVTLSHDQIARHLGTAREVVSRVLKHMAEDGLLSVSRGEITLKDKSSLRRLAAPRLQ